MIIIIRISVLGSPRPISNGMKTAQDIYREYKIMPALQLHQLRVAAVGKSVCDSLKIPVHTNDVVLACLFHDMGNVVKFDLERFPEFLEPKGLEYWQGVQKEFFAKYGREQHAANEAIAKEIGLPEKVQEYICNIGFSKIESMTIDLSSERKICQYADLRVGPHGILSVEERMREGRERYRGMRDWAEHTEVSEEKFEATVTQARSLEKQIFKHAAITPEDITDESTKNMIEELRKFPVA